ncbi:MAG: DUF6159 family protein [Ilumatobacteraceae bacterium]
MSSAPPPPPLPPVVASSTPPTGGKLIGAAWQALRQDRELIAMPVIGAGVALAAIAPIALAGVALPSDATAGFVVLGVLMMVVGTVISTFFAVALAAGAHVRLDGGSPTIGSSVGVAWSRRWTVVRWALMSVTVGIVLQVLEDKLKNAGTIVRILGGAAWAMASFFTIPVIAVNAVGPIEALKISSTTFRQRWSSAARVQLRTGLYALGIVAGVVVCFVVVVALASVSPALAIVVGVLLGAMCLAAMLVLGAVSAYSRVVLYRYASGLATPGFSTSSLDAAVTAAR